MIGVDEAGRGPLAGPVCAAAVALPPGADQWGLADSKTLRERRRLALAERVRAEARAWSLGWASVEEIDQLNILQATLLAMHRAVQGCLVRLGSLEPILVDGSIHPAAHLRSVAWDWPTETLVGGDALRCEISAASILAKTARDEEMRRLDLLHPGYGFARHAGYPTAAHRAALRVLGPSPVHRRSFRL
jgi:ribonuclease HII